MSAPQKSQKRFICNLNELVPTLGTTPLTILSENADKSEGKFKAVENPAKLEKAKHQFFTRDFSQKKPETTPVISEYSAEELKCFTQIQARVKEIAAKYNRSEEEIEELFLQSSCNWDKVEGKFKAEGMKEWTQDEDQMIRKLLQGKGQSELLQRIARITKQDY